MTTGAISPLRRRMIEDMNVRGFMPKTQQSYIRAVREFTAFFGRAPDQAEAEDIRRYRVYLRDHGTSTTSMNAAVSGLRFFFAVTLDRPAVVARMTTVREPRKLPVVLSPGEVAAMLQAAPGLKDRAALSVAYAAVLHTWGSAMTHHPHLRCIVPGGGFSPDGQRWIACRPGFFLPVRVLSRLFRRLVLEQLALAHAAGQLAFFGDHAGLADPQAFARHLAPLREQEWVVYAKRPFAGPEAVLAYLARYTHRVAIANSRLLRLDETGVTFRWKDYRLEGRTRHKTMTLPPAEFIRRFLLHVLPAGFHRIRHYGFLANARRVANVVQARALIAETALLPRPDEKPPNNEPPFASLLPCPHCGGIMAVIETFLPGTQPRAPPSGPAAVAIAS